LPTDLAVSASQPGKFGCLATLRQRWRIFLEIMPLLFPAEKDSILTGSGPDVHARATSGASVLV